MLTVAIAMKVPPEKEWNAFTMREPTLLKPDHKPHDPETAVFPFSDHALTKPVLEGDLMRKSTMLKYSTPRNPEKSLSQISCCVSLLFSPQLLSSHFLSPLYPFSSHSSLE